MNRGDILKCKFCESEMRLDDTDFNFKGNKDNYWVCDNCETTAFEKIRYGKSISVEFQEQEEIAEDDDYCYECGGYGDDYSVDDNGELVCNCDDYPNNPANNEDDW